MATKRQINGVIEAINKQSDWEDHDAFMICPAVERFMEKTSSSSDAFLEKMFKRGDHPDYPIAVWKEKRLLIDGHRRYRMAEKLGVSLTIHEMSFDSVEDMLEWMLDHQQSGRNISSRWVRHADEMRLSLETLKLGHGDRLTEVDDICERLKISRATFYRQREKAEVLDGLIPQLSVMFHDGEVHCSSSKMKKIADLDAEEQRSIYQGILDDPHFLKNWGNEKEKAKKKSNRKKIVHDEEPKKEDPRVTVLPSDVKTEAPTPVFDEVKVPKPEHVSNERLKEYVADITKAYGKFSRAMDTMVNDFLPEGAAKVDWKKRVDRAHRQINQVIEEITEQFDG